MDSAPPPGISAATTPPKTSAQAITSLVLGILSNTCLWIFGSIPAILLGILAILKINREPEALGGKGLAIAGIATGGAGLLVGLVPMGILAAIIMPAFVQMNAKAQLAKQAGAVREMLVACHFYAEDDPEGKFPPTLKILVDEGLLDDESLLEAVNPETGESEAYLYQAGLTIHDPAKPLIFAPGWLGGKRVVGFTDGTVESLRKSEWEESVGPLP